MLEVRDVLPIRGALGMLEVWEVLLALMISRCPDGGRRRWELEEVSALMISRCPGDDKGSWQFEKPCACRYHPTSDGTKWT